LNLCSTNLDSLAGEVGELKKNYNRYELGGYGWTLLAISISFLIALAVWLLCDKKFKNLSDKNVELIMKSFFVILSSFWGLFFIPFQTFYWRLIIGGVAGFFVFLGYKKAILYLKHNVFKIPRKDFTSIRKLNIDDDYFDILEDNGVDSVEDLLECDLKDLSEETRLQVETLIDFSKKGRLLLKHKKK
jgi:hypothetical protein